MESSSSNHLPRNDRHLPEEEQDNSQAEDSDDDLPPPHPANIDILPVSSQHLPVQYQAPPAVHISTRQLRLQQIKEVLSRANKKYDIDIINSAEDYYALSGRINIERAERLANKFYWQAIFMKHLNRTMIIIAIFLGGISVIIGLFNLAYVAAIITAVMTILLTIHSTFGIGTLGIKEKRYSISCNNIKDTLTAALVDESINDEELKNIINDATHQLNSMDLSAYEESYGPQSISGVTGSSHAPSPQAVSTVINNV